MKRLILITALALAGCTTPAPEGVTGLKGTYDNDCLPQAAAMCEGLKAKGIDADVISIVSGKWHHALCCYIYPVGSNHLWAWDSYWGSVPLIAWRNQPDSIANAFLRYAALDKYIPAKAEFLE